MLIGFIIGWLVFSGSLCSTGNAKYVLNNQSTDQIVGGGICKCPDNMNGGQCSQHKSKSSCESSTCTGEFGGNNTGCTWATSPGAIK